MSAVDLQTRIAIHLIDAHGLNPVSPWAAPLGLEDSLLSLFLPEDLAFREQRLLHEKDQGLLVHETPERTA